MKQFSMTDRKEPPGRKSVQKSSPSDSAFDKWLNRGLHELFDDVMKEAVPPEMLKLLKPDKTDDAAARPTLEAKVEPKEDTKKT